MKYRRAVYGDKCPACKRIQDHDAIELYNGSTMCIHSLVEEAPEGAKVFGQPIDIKCKACGEIGCKNVLVSSCDGDEDYDFHCMSQEKNEQRDYTILTIVGFKRPKKVRS